MDVIQKLYLEKQAFKDDLRPKYVIPDLITRKVITHKESIEILAKDKPQDQVEALLDKLRFKNSSELKEFIKVLEKDQDGCSTYPWLAEKLDTTINLNDDVYRILIDGNVPFSVNHLLPREDKLYIIQNSLKLAAEKRRHWVVLYGSFGSGKSVLAAEAVRNNNLIKKHFFNGVYWLQIGKLREDEAVKNKIKKMFKLMDCKNEFLPNDSISDLTLMLRKEVCKRQKILLILDEVWDVNVLKAFDVGCPILVTTNNRSISDMFVSDSTLIECRYDLDIKEISYILSKYVRCEPHQLPEVVDSICAKCKGSPLIASLIGSIMADAGNNEKKWEDLNERLELRGTSTLRRRMNSGDSKYSKDLGKIIDLCLEPIEQLKNYYLDFLIFHRDIPISNEVLEKLWELSYSEVFDIMCQLYNRCFVYMEQSEEDKHSFSYSSHDLYLEILKEQVGDTDKKNRHKKVVERILKLIGESDGSHNLMKAPKSYIPFTIGYHLYEAGEYKMLEKLFLDLEFIEQKILLTNSIDILSDYQSFRRSFENEKHVEMFEEFINKNATALMENKSDIIQLGLFEPNDSIVYKKAKDLACKRNDGNYFDWCNKDENVHSLFNCTIKHCEGSEHAVFNHNASLVAVVGSRMSLNGETNGFVLIWSCSTFDESQELSGHADVINYCAFNSKGDRLATASNDKTVKIFKIGESLTSSGNYSKKRGSIPNLLTTKSYDNSILTFTEHRHEVVCCSYSPDNNYIISSDVTGTTYVWDFITEEKDQHWTIKFKNQHTHPKSSFSLSSFSNDGKTFGTAVYDTIKLWDFKTGNLKYSLCHDGYLVKTFMFAKNDSHVLSVYDNIISDWTLSNENEKSVVGSYWDKSYVICSSCLSPNEEYIACGTSSASVIIINMKSQIIVNNLRGHNGDVVNVMFSKDGTKLLSVSSTKFIIHDVSLIQDTPLVSFEGNLSVHVDMKESEEITVATSNYFNSLEVRKGLNGQLVLKSASEDDCISACSLSKDCSEIVYGTKSGAIKVFRIATKCTLELLPCHYGQVNYILYSKYDSTFFTCSADRTIKVWKNNSHYSTLTGHTHAVVRCVEFTKFRNKLLTCSKDGSLRVWDVSNSSSKENRLLVIEGHGNQDVTFCDVSPDDKFLASASVDGTIKVWNAENGEHYRTFLPENEDLNKAVRCCRFSPFGQFLIGGLDNGKVVFCYLLGNQGAKVLPSYHDSVVQKIMMIDSNDETFKSSFFLSVSNSIKLWCRQGTLLHTILLPSSFMGTEPPFIWTSDNFNILVVILNSILYILKRIE
ncbi:apoptotic protease-activating factor 1 [Nephila pilipes]|uniref:Apoptotic protease-activating factor 1 n=1 Tax=Nephila pilipes TaxID=299642 RepID=A0A8X6Q6N1_NEPPI|nr:apoptotic protease-activating factor 1 [Nephila pilipes]